jgi:hypothetical protein
MVSDAAFMTPAEKGQRYSKVFRKAGNLLSKGKIARAIEVLKEGEALALQLGDLGMARQFAAEAERAQKDLETSG